MAAEEAGRLYPILVADLADDAGRDFIAGVALANGVVHLHLVSAPVDATTHKLELYTPSHVAPTLFLAEPLGPPTSAGFPLRVRPYASSGESTLHTSGFVPRDRPANTSAIAPARPSRHRLSERHAQELAGQKAGTGDNPQALVGRSLAGGKLKIESLIGEGGVGSVYRAWHRDLRIHVAVKVLLEDVQSDIEFCRRFHAEALAASRLDHMNLMRVYDFGQEPDGLLYLAMEHLAGRSLGETLVKGRGLPEARICDLMIQVCAGLSHAHARGIVHRDIKPDNLILVPSRDDDGHDFELVKVCDFGIAVLENNAASAAVAGTPQYMSPEQCRGDTVLDGRSDVYACGVVLFELATGELPFHAPTAVGLLNRHLNMQPPPPRAVNPTVSPRLEAIILKALEKEPDDRFASVRELRNALRELVHDDVVRAPAPPLPAPARSLSSSQPDWLERKSLHEIGPTETSARTVSFEGPGITSLVMELSTKPAGWLAALVATPKQEQYEGAIKLLGWVVPLLVEDGCYKSLFAIRCTLDMIADDAHAAPWRRAGADAVLLVLTEPPFLGKLASLALTEPSPPREVTELLHRGGVPAAYALYSARLKLASVAGVRARFVELVRAYGANAMPMIRAGLAKLEAKRAHEVAEHLAIDLMEAAPRTKDDAAGEIVARYLGANASPALTVAASTALVALWADRAAPILLALLEKGDDAARVAAIRGLGTLRCIDERIVPKIVQIAGKGASREIRTAARAALADVIGPARGAAERALLDLGLGSHARLPKA